MERFYLFALFAFLMWLLVMALCTCCWWYDKKRLTPVEYTPAINDVTSTFEYDSNVNFDSPSYETKSCVIQPGSKVKSLGAYDSEKEMICTRSIPIQPQNTPALYNLHTGRHSYDSSDIRNSSDSFQKVTSDQVSKEVLLVKKESNIKFKNISSSDSERSSMATLNERPGGYEVLLTTETEKLLKPKGNENHTVQAIIEQPTHEQEIQIRTKYDHCAKAQEPTKVRLPSDSDDNDEELFKHIDMDIRLSDQNISSHDQDGRLLAQSGGIEHLKESDTPDADRLSQNMPVFDDYLHLVSIETPLSPREVFFSDLIKQANETEQRSLRTKEAGNDRRSYCIGDITYNKLNYDHRKSVPLFLYSDQWRKESQTVEDGEVPEQNVDSDDNQELDQVVVGPFDQDSQDIEHVQRPEPKGADIKIVEMNPKKKDCEDSDLKMMTQMFINEEKLIACAPVVDKRPPEDQSRSLKPSIEELDVTYKPRFPKGKPLKLRESEDSQIIEPKTKPEVKEVFEPEIEKSLAKSRCCEDEPTVIRPMPKQTATSTEGKRKSSSEYFIADVVSRPHQSVTSEVFLTVGVSGLVSDVSEKQEQDLQPQKSDQGARAPIDLGNWGVLGKQDMKRELSQDKLEYKSEDDEVFEDVQMALGKLRRNK